VHHHLVREGTRTQVALIVESGEPREVMHFALLIGYGASAVNPYLAIETLEEMRRDAAAGPHRHFDKALKNYKKAINKGLLKSSRRWASRRCRAIAARRSSRPSG
jgi:glutamate synthase (NADPH) large chain